MYPSLPQKLHVLNLLSLPAIKTWIRLPNNYHFYLWFTRKTQNTKEISLDFIKPEISVTFFRSGIRIKWTFFRISVRCYCNPQVKSDSLDPKQPNISHK